ncbi:HPr kinase/phosphorylase [Qipengyuania spongiae]|uniref:HPr kinase/phosphatase C-terminal domain-containing protein n=1 Tax=Qipengyuania spongiae TaxID=2909673 RepID=A0ABY5T1T9_9SPHN|nr:HPr kinase/phosphatase C-terminal domain-containing protein [Qipengyuania spongiae]UVI40767.1 HPr kinase/phosphatase C-terminal domain-containing protein [Qipengyuania spongiae]
MGPTGVLLNVTCVAIGGRGLLIEGTPGSGKSSLALALIDRGAVLVGDDGIAFELRDGRCLAMPPPNIAGLIEIRGVGPIEVPTTSAPIALVLSLDPDAPRSPEPGIRLHGGCPLPILPFRAGDAVQALRAEAALRAFGID